MMRAFVLLAAVALAACGDDPDHQIYFSGSVWNGATGERLLSYKIKAITRRDEVVTGSVSKAGQYLVGPLEPWNDFTIEIEAEGYRSFHSHNRMLNLPGVFNDAQDWSKLTSAQSFVFDAYLFPVDLVTPPATLFLVSDDEAAPLSGKLRLAPSTSSALNSGSAPIPGQVWANDDDLQVGTLVKDFSGGQLALGMGELVYGVSYNVTIYDVPKHQLTSVVYQAGIHGNQRYVVQEVAAPPFQMLSMNKPGDASATVEITFSEDIEFALHPSGYGVDWYRETIDSSFSISSADVDGDTVSNTLKADVSESVQERGTSITIDGNRLTLSWNRTTGLQTSDPDDPIGQAQWGGMLQIYVQPVGEPDKRTALYYLIGMTSISVNDLGN